MLNDVRLCVMPVDVSDHVVLISDGIVEARNISGQMYGVARFEKVAKQGILTKNLPGMVMQDVNEFCENTVQEMGQEVEPLRRGGGRRTDQSGRRRGRPESSAYESRAVNSGRRGPPPESAVR